MTFNEWFCSLPEGRQAVLRDDKWMLAQAAWDAATANERYLNDNLFRTAKAFYNATVAQEGVRITSQKESLRDAATMSGEDLRSALLSK